MPFTSNYTVGSGIHVMGPYSNLIPRTEYDLTVKKISGTKSTRTVVLEVIKNGEHLNDIVLRRHRGPKLLEDAIELELKGKGSGLKVGIACKAPTGYHFEWRGYNSSFYR